MIFTTGTKHQQSCSCIASDLQLAAWLLDNILLSRQAARVRTKMLSMTVQAKKVQLSSGDSDENGAEAETQTQVTHITSRQANMVSWEC